MSRTDNLYSVCKDKYSYGCSNEVVTVNNRVYQELLKNDPWNLRVSHRINPFLALDIPDVPSNEIANLLILINDFSDDIFTFNVMFHRDIGTGIGHCLDHE